MQVGVDEVGVGVDDVGVVDFLPSPPHSLKVKRVIPDEENLIIDVVNNEKQNDIEFPISSDINTKIKLLEDEVISKRRARNRLRSLYLCKTISLVLSNSLK